MEMCDKKVLGKGNTKDKICDDCKCLWRIEFRRMFNPFWQRFNALETPGHLWHSLEVVRYRLREFAKPEVFYKEGQFWLSWNGPNSGDSSTKFGEPEAHIVLWSWHWCMARLFFGQHQADDF